MEKENEPLIDEKHPETAKEFWDQLMELVDGDDVSAVEHLLLNRPENLINSKLPGEDEIWT
ncbi:MAG: hypothetical protein Q8Q48_03350 [Candidatus Staskawiczbacteria bacterium]|nr:hypothetical protein [Candidatus Staskawiczbacteria bacterium]